MTHADYVLAYAVFRLAWVGLGLLGCALLWRYPRAKLAAALVIGLHLLAWAAYRLPLVGSYGWPGNDRRFNLGTAACVAAGNSPRDGMQVGMAAVEPFWDVVVAVVSGFAPQRVMAVYDGLTPLIILLVGLALYLGLRSRGAVPAGEEEAWDWERVLIVLAVLGLSSLSLSGRPPLWRFFIGNFMLKPNHTAGFAAFAIVLGLVARRASAWKLGAMLGLMAWLFLLHWAYAVPILLLIEWLRPREERRYRRLFAALGLSLVIALPLILNLARDYQPMKGSSLAAQVWDTPGMATDLAVPHWMSLDLGPLLIMGVIGALAMRRRGWATDIVLVATLVAGVVFNAAQGVLAPLGVAPEVDELHHFLRFGMALACGSGLAFLARGVSQWRGLAVGRGHLLVLAATLPLCFPAYWDPPTMDSMFGSGVKPLPGKVVAAAEWIRSHTPGDAVLVASPQMSAMLPALTGRRMLHLAEFRPPDDVEQRLLVERTLLRGRDAGDARRAAARYGVTHIVMDPEMRSRYHVGRPRPKGLFSQVFAYEGDRLAIFAIEPGPGPARVPE